MLSETRNVQAIADADLRDIVATLEKLAALIRARGHAAQAYTPQSLQNLLQMNSEQRQLVRARLQSATNMMGSAESIDSATGPDADGEDKFFIEMAARKLGLIYDKGVYDRINKGNLVEIYNTDLVQVFRNFAFFDVCSYTLADLHTYEFFELYDRSQLIIQYILDATVELSNRPFDLSPLSLEHTPSHLLQEKFSEQKLTCMAKFKWMYPVYVWPQTLYGYMVIMEGEVLSELPKQDLAFI